MEEIICMGLEDGLGNAFIELDELEVKEISVDIVEKYCNAVVKRLREQGYRAKTYFSREATNSVEHTYRNVFTFLNDENGNLTSVKLKDDINSGYLIDRFRKYMSFDLMITCMDDDIVDEYLKSNFIDKNKTKAKTLSHK